METIELSTPVNRGAVASSGVSWGAAIGGASVMAALSLIMLALGAGFGLSVVSPWSNVGVSTSTIGTAAIVWLVATQAIASSTGGYLTGRLRTTWNSLHNDEVHFRDTANGLISWCVSVVVAVAFLTSAATSMAGGAAQASELTSARRAAEQNDIPLGSTYLVDRLFRVDRSGTAEAGTTAADISARAEASRIIANSLRYERTSASDTGYLTQLVAADTGLSQSDADKRVAEIMGDARQTAELARKALARLLLWTFLALLIGAFCASFAATIGGRQHDNVRVI
jgi:hypothetical protein